MHGSVVSDSELTRDEVMSQLNLCRLSDSEWQEVCAGFGCVARDASEAIKALSDYILNRRRLMGLPEA
jgi:hypothetical protein